MGSQVIHAGDVEAKNGVFKPLTAELGVAGFKLNQLELPAGGSGPEHDHAANGEEEVYAVIAGGGTLRMDGEDIPLQPGHFVYCPPNTRRQMIAGDDGLTWIGIGSASAE
jgi:quercetin dioxygenase-like cupin family protein